MSVTLALAFAPGTAAAATTFTVTSTADASDSTPGDGSCASASDGCTLRAAVQEANALAGADTIDVPAGTYTLALAGTGEDAAATGDLDVTQDLTVTGASARTVTVTAKTGTAQPIDRIFDVIAGTLTLSRANLIDGKASPGGIIRAAGALDLTDVMIQRGIAGSAGGGGVSSSAPLSLDRVTVADNNGLSGQGGGVLSSGGLTVVNSTFWSNSASSGGGLALPAGAADIRNATFTWNTASSNSTPQGAHIYNGGSINLANSIFERGSVGNCGGNAIVSGGHNVDDDGSCGLAGPGDRGFPFYGWTYYKLANGGGETDVIPPFDTQSGYQVPGPAVDIGGTGCPAIDQRGVARPQGASCDAGAYEATFADLVITASDAPAHVRPGETFSQSIVVRNDGPNTAQSAGLGFSGGFGFFAMTATPGSACPSLGNCFFGPLAPGASATVGIQTTVPADTKATTMSITYFTSDDTPPGKSNIDTNKENSFVTVTVAIDQPSTQPLTQPPPPAALKPGACANAKTGTPRGDSLMGTTAGDLLKGLAGNDRLVGLQGGDCLDGGPGNDRLDGGPGNDKLTGGRGRDVLRGGAGRDSLNAADGARDTVDCGKGRDSARVDKRDRVRGCEKVKRVR